MKIFLLTGDREAGKTTFCAELCRRAENRGFTLAGILTLTERNVKLRAMDLISQETRTLALTGEKRPIPKEKDAPQTAKWAFTMETLLWGNRKMERTSPADLFILDEAGILEFERNQGWSEGMRRTDQHRDKTAVVVVRPELIEAALKRWPEAEVLRIDPQHREEEESLLTRVLDSN